MTRSFVFAWAVVGSLTHLSDFGVGANARRPTKPAKSELPPRHKDAPAPATTRPSPAPRPRR